MPNLEVAIPRPQRWDVPFSEQMTDRDVDQLLAVEPLRNVDAEAFPPALPLRGLLRNDTRIVQYEQGDLIVREGDYGNSAFMILAGTVRVALERLDPQLLGRSAPPRPGWKQAIAQLWQNARLPEVRSPEQLAAGLLGAVGTRTENNETRIFLQDVPRLLDHTGTVRLGAGEIFGELAALSRTPRTATVFADGPATLLEIRWQGLRDLMRRTPAIRDHVDRMYRTNSLRVHLRETSLLKDLPAAVLDRVVAATEFESHGNFDWYTDFGPQRKQEPAERLAAEPLIAVEGQVPIAIYLVRSGFVRVSRRHGHGEQTIAYLGKGHVFGLTELMDSQATGQEVPLQHSLRAVGYVDLLKIPAEVVVASILPNLPNATGSANIGSKSDRARNKRDEKHAQNPSPSDPPAIDSRTLDFLADGRFLNGTQTMIINLDRCTRCDDCVRACAATHDNNPRFVRQGPKHDHLMVANACMHCTDPVCMIGCPTGAIARDEGTGIVRINDRTCIGCATCANSCPYDAIRMVEIRDTSGAFLVDEATKLPILKATKCDLCADQLTGPACQQACPHDALVRIDMDDAVRLASWLGR